MTENVPIDGHNYKDEVIQEVRSTREGYAARYGYDVRAILRRARERAKGTDTKTRKPRRVRVSESS